MICIDKIQKVTNDESAVSGIDGWLFTDFGGRDKLTLSLLQLPKQIISSRRWIYILQPNASPIKIQHIIEKNNLDELPCGSSFYYSTQKELISILKQFTNKKFALFYDKNIPIISTIDAGFVDLLKESGIELISAASLVQRTNGLRSKKGIESHERASSLLYKIISDTWNFITEYYYSQEELTEWDVCAFIMDQLIKYNLTTSHLPVVCFGQNTANPHYTVSSTNASKIKIGDVIQLDIWAKERFVLDENGNKSSKDAIYADISWVGIFDTKATKEQNEMFEVLCKARNEVVKKLKENTHIKSNITGSMLDKVARKVLCEAGFEDNIKHRTGHGIDIECHGSGVNLDSVEFPDNRFILPFSCFSIEPGLYKKDFGMRTEINIYITGDYLPIISGRLFDSQYINELKSIPQKSLLLVKEKTNETNN